jgi:putative hydrolase of the HAD superfamily
MRENIEAIIFDLGGVLINLDYNKTVIEMKKLGIDLDFSKANQNELFDLLEEGKIEPEKFLEELQSSTKNEVSYDQITIAWNSILLDFPTNRLKLLKELRKEFPLYLFSNTNAIHIAEVNSILSKEHGIPNLSGFFDHVYLSHELGLRKPKVEAFQAIIDEQKLNPKRTLFIDDSIQHIEGARNAKLVSEHLELQNEDIHGLLKRLKFI